MTDLPLHLILLKSGSHSPLPVHVEALDPVSVNPSGQLNVMVVPSIVGFL